MEENRVHEVIIIGGGPAGMTAGLYTTRRGMVLRVRLEDDCLLQIHIAHIVQHYLNCRARRSKRTLAGI